MSEIFKAKNVEIYLAQIDDEAGFDISARGNDNTILAYIDSAVGASDVSGWTKVTGVDKVSEFTVESNDDESTTSNYYGSDSSGNQNSETETTVNNELNITLSTSSQFGEVLTEKALDFGVTTHTTYADYKSYNMASRTTNTLLMVVRVKRLKGTTYYFKTFAIVDPVFLNTGGVSGASDDASLTSDYSLVGNKTKVYVDYYSNTADETTTNIVL